MRFAKATPSFLLPVVMAALAGCQSSPPAPPPHAPRPVVELARWQVWEGDRVVGYVRHLEIRDPSGPLPYYRIEDPNGRWLGHASATGRFTRRVPFEEEEQDIGVWSMPRGVGELVEAKSPVRLQPVPVEADARRR
jgi:hypothetical protein